MRKATIRTIWMLGFLMAALVSGCGREQVTAPVTPFVISTIPANGATAVPVAQIVSANFSEAMNAATITTSTFTLTGPGATSVAGTVTYSGVTAAFTPNARLTANTLYTATITTGATDTINDPLTANSVWSFTTSPNPTVISTIPAAGAVGVPLSQKISATFSVPMNAATLTTPGTFILAVGGVGGASVAGTVTYTAATNTALFSPTAALAPNTQYTATITTAAQSAQGNNLAANFSSSFTTGPIPTVIATVPLPGAVAVPLNQKLSATFSAPMNAGTLTTAGTFILALGGVGGASVPGAVTFDVPSNTTIFSPTSALTANTQYTATITPAAQSALGNNLPANFNWSFTTGAAANGIPPTVTFTNPAAAAVNVPLNQQIAATFSVPMNPATISAAGTFTVAATAGGAPVLGAVTFSGNSAVFSPTANLAPSTQYTATITTAAKDLTGVAMAANFVWNFTTGLTATAVAPTVTAIVPAAAAIAVPLNQRVSATFSVPMNPASILAPGTMTLAVAGVGGANVPGTVALAGSTAVFTPNANLAASTQYTATITPAAQNLTGTPLAANFVSSFTTGVAAGAVAPAITATSPLSAAINVPVNAAVNATFSAAMDPTTVNNANFTLAIAGGGAGVPGTVTYNPATQIATFTPLANLTLGTLYTATVSNQVENLNGLALAPGVAPNPWTFTVGAIAGPVGPPLGAAATFGSFGGGAGITNQGTLTVINGDIGTTAVSTAVTGFHDAGVGCIYTETPLNVGFVNGKIYTAAPPPTTVCNTEGTAPTFVIATQAAADALTAYNNLLPASRPGGADPGAGQLGGLTLAPGIYKSAGGIFQITGSDLTLDAQNNPNAIWVFQMATSLTVGAPGAPRNVTLINGAQAKNVFWQVGSAATINAAGGGTMVGTIIASAGVTFSTAGNVTVTTLNGRALGLNASVTVVNTVVNVPAP